VKFGGAVYSLVRISQSCSHCRSSSYIDLVELSDQNLLTRSVFSDASEPPSLISIIHRLSISGAPDTRVTKEFRIFSERTMLNNLQLIAQDNRYQLLDSPETDPVQYVSNQPGIAEMSKQHRVDVSYPETCLPYSSLARSIQPSLILLRNDVEAHIKGTTLSSLMVSDLTLNAYSIHLPILICRHSLFTCNLTPDTPLNSVYPLRITVEHFFLLHWKHIFFLPECF